MGVILTIGHSNMQLLMVNRKYGMAQTKQMSF